MGRKSGWRRGLSVNADMCSRGWIIRKYGRGALTILKSHGNGKRGAYAMEDIVDCLYPSSMEAPKLHLPTFVAGHWRL